MTEVYENLVSVIAKLARTLYPDDDDMAEAYFKRHVENARKDTPGFDAFLQARSDLLAKGHRGPRR
jgi:hypothetical protein